MNTQRLLISIFINSKNVLKYDWLSTSEWMMYCAIIPHIFHSDSGINFTLYYSPPIILPKHIFHSDSGINFTLCYDLSMINIVLTLYTIIYTNCTYKCVSVVGTEFPRALNCHLYIGYSLRDKVERISQIGNPSTHVRPHISIKPLQSHPGHIILMQHACVIII